MHRSLRLGCLALVLGAWLALTAASWVIASASFSTVARLRSADADPTIPGQRWRDAMAASEDGPAAARYQAAELNRWVFGTTGRAQVVLAALALLLAAWPGTEIRWSAAAIALAALLAAGLTTAVVPWASGLGRDLAFAPEPPPREIADALEAMEGLHATYGALDVLKTLLLIVAATGTVRALRVAGSPPLPRTAQGRRPLPRRGRRRDEPAGGAEADRSGSRSAGDLEQEP